MQTCMIRASVMIAFAWVVSIYMAASQIYIFIFCRTASGRGKAYQHQRIHPPDPDPAGEPFWGFHCASHGGGIRFHPQVH